MAWLRVDPSAIGPRWRQRRETSGLRSTRKTGARLSVIIPGLATAKACGADSRRPGISPSESREAVLAELEDANSRYERKFGYIFIVRASGRTAEEMLTLLRARLDNDPRTEIRIAVAQQAEITALRLDAIG